MICKKYAKTGFSYSYCLFSTLADYPLCCLIPPPLLTPKNFVGAGTDDSCWSSVLAGCATGGKRSITEVSALLADTVKKMLPQGVLDWGRADQSLPIPKLIYFLNLQPHSVFSCPTKLQLHYFSTKGFNTTEERSQVGCTCTGIHVQSIC